MMWDAVPAGESFHYNVQYKHYTLFNIILTYPPPLLVLWVIVFKRFNGLSFYQCVENANTR